MTAGMKVVAWGVVLLEAPIAVAVAITKTEAMIRIERFTASPFLSGLGFSWFTDGLEWSLCR
jgi:hypothetical protein